MDGWLKGLLVVAGVGWDAGWRVGWTRGPPEPRDPCPARVTRHFGGPEPTQLSRRNPLINSGYQTLGLGTRDFQIFLLSLMAHKGPADIYIYIYLCIYIYIHIYYI
jgi:hypothetical protein